MRERSLARTGLRVPHPGSVAATTSVPATFQRRLHPGKLRPPGRFRLAFLLLVRAVLSLSLHAGSDPDSIRAVYSRSLLSTVNENDARAALKAYSRTLAMEISLTNRITADLVDGVDALARALKTESADVFSISTEEFFLLEPLGLAGPFIAPFPEGTVGEELIVLVRRDATTRNLADLAGLQLNLLRDPHHTLGRSWLELLCLESGLGRPEQLLAKLTTCSKPTQALLPVFFGKSDACLVSRGAWTVMGDLNPKVKSDLRLIAVSPLLIPSLTCFRQGFSPEIRQRIVANATRATHSPAFQQLLGLFKTDRFRCLDAPDLQITRDFVARHRRATSKVPPQDPSR